jgi:hypothetical protein
MDAPFTSSLGPLSTTSWGYTLLSDAKAKGQDRIRQADQLRQQDTALYRIASKQNYQNRYNTIVVPDDYEGNTMSIGEHQQCSVQTYVKGKGDEFCCYLNRLEYDNEEDRWIFYGDANFKRRPPDDPVYRDYPFGCGKFDNEVEWEGTQPLPHEDVMWNQVREVNERRNGSISPDIHYGPDIIHAKDKKIIDALMPNIGEMTFNRNDDGYAIVLGIDTAKAKPKVGVLFGKSIPSITIEKKPDEFLTNKIRYSIK